MPDQQQIIGIVAGICTAVSLLPQLIKIIKEKKAADISYFMLIILMTGVACGVWYGVLKKDYPIIVTNSFSFLVNTAVLFFRIKYHKR